MSAIATPERRAKAEFEADLAALQDELARCREVLASLDSSFERLATLCHQINNPLTTLVGRAQLLRLAGTQDPQIDRTAQAMTEAAERIAEHVREVAAISRAGRAALGGRSEF